MSNASARSALLAVALCLWLLASAGTAAERDHDIEPEDYFTLVSISSCAISPDGSMVAYTELGWGEPDERRSTDLWVVDTATGKRRRLTFGRVGASSPMWGSDGLIYFTAGLERAGEDRAPWDGTAQVWRVSPDGGEPFPVTRCDGGVDGFDLAGQETLYYITGTEVISGEWKDLQEELSGLEYGRGVEQLSEVWALDLESWRARKVLEANRVVREISLAPDRRHLAMITSPEQELVTHEGWSRVEVLDLEDGQISNLTPAEWRRDHPSPFGWLEGLAWSSDSGALAFAMSFDGYPTEMHVAE
jgi:hypothetical protein